MNEEHLLQTFLRPIRLCANYTPKFGGGEKVDVKAFRDLYGSDTFYSLIGLNDDLMYAAHRAAGGITSIYRQIGVGSERLIREIAVDVLKLSQAQIDWSYEYDNSRGKIGIHKLDARIRLSDLDMPTRKRFQNWIHAAKKVISTGQDGKYHPDGVVFEIRQGYKSADAKRQNADIRFAARANQDGLLPVVMVMSNQISKTIIDRYRRDGLLVTTGVIEDDPCISSFALTQTLFDFDLLNFFTKHQELIRQEIHSVVQALLTAQ